MPVSSPPILKILSDLDIDLMDVDNDMDYLRALMEATNALTITNANDKRIPILQEEIQRVRADRKAADPKFKQRVKKTTVSPKKIMGQKMLPPAKVDVKKLASKGGGGSSDALSQILVSVTSIRDILINQIKGKRDDAKKKRRATENAKRDKKESGLEILKKGFGAVKKGAEKVVKPVKSLFKQVFDFIGKIVLGRIVFKLLEWFSDKKNEGKVKAIGKFLKKTWPALLASYLLFGNSFGRMTVRLGVMIAKFTVRLVSKVIPALWSAVAKMKLGKLMNMIPGGGGKAGILIKGATLFGGGMLLEKALAGDTKMSEEDMANAQGFNKGGKVPGSGPNKDTVPAMLTPGEFVMSKGAVQKYGVDTLEGMNAAAGGTNVPVLMPNKKRKGFNEGGKAADRPGIVTDPKEIARIKAETLHWVNKERVEFLGLPPLKEITVADGVELTKPMGSEYYGKGIKEQSSEDMNFDTMTKTTWKTKSRGAEVIFQGATERITEEEKQAYLDSNPLARMAMELKDQMEMDALGADISASAKMKGGGLVQGFQGGGEVKGTSYYASPEEEEEAKLHKTYTDRRLVSEATETKGAVHNVYDHDGNYAFTTYGPRPGSTREERIERWKERNKKKKKGGGLFGGIKRAVGGTADQLTGNLFDFDKRSGGGLIRKTAGAFGGLFGGGKKEGGVKKTGGRGRLKDRPEVQALLGDNKDKYKAPPKTDAVKKTGSSSGILGPISSDQSKMVNKDKYKVNPPVKKSVVHAYNEQAEAKIITLPTSNTTPKTGGSNELPDIDASAKRSKEKIKLLGISV